RARSHLGKRGDSPLHLAARGGNLGKVKEIFQKLDEEGIKELLSKKNQEGESALYVATENGHFMVVGEFLKHLDLQTASIAANNGYDPFHVAAKQGHLEVLMELLHSFPNLVMTTDSTNYTALHTAAAQGHTEVVNLLLNADSNLANTVRNNVKGQNAEFVLELIKPDPSVTSLEDNKGNTALHIATRKGRIQIVQCLLSVEGININAINKTGETPLDIADKFGPPELFTILKDAGATHSKDHGKPPTAAKQLRQTVSNIKHAVHYQLHQGRRTRSSVREMAEKLNHISDLKNAVNSATVVAVLIATVAFAAIFTVPGQYVEDKTKGVSLGQAKIANSAAFIIFFLFDSTSLFISLAVVVVQTSMVVIEDKAKMQLMFVINKLMWCACLFISIAFISLTYVVVGSHQRWLAVYATVIGGSIMLTTIGFICCFGIRRRIKFSKRRNKRRGEILSRSKNLQRQLEEDVCSLRAKET
ncbi:hypothetical protein RJ640_000158, partial [Escallonia rubra]